jgi:ribosome biogenesis GTPase / thiamine phosphate phosphatase
VRPDPGGAIVARVVAVFGRRCVIELPDGIESEAVRHGSLRQIAVGDLVEVTADSPMRIASVAPRTSLLFRSDAHRSKVLAANVGQVAVVFAPQPRFSLHFLWRALIAARAAGIDVLAVLNKIDLDCAQADRVLAQLTGLGARGLRIGAKADPAASARALGSEFEDRATLLVGQSGMGKSTIANLLVGMQARTQALSARSQSGRHTTSASRWHRLRGGHGALVDTPGFQEFGLSHLARSALPALMPDLAPHAAHCRFADCMHLHEPDCGVRAALTSGRIEAERYAFYRQLSAECPA